MIRPSLYLTTSRLDIIFATCMCARFQSDPRESHLNAVKRIFRYLCGTLKLGIFYQKSSKFELIRFYDAEYAGRGTDWKSTSGTYHFIDDSLVAWYS